MLKIPLKRNCYGIQDIRCRKAILQADDILRS